MKHPEMRNTVFGQVVVELLERRGIEPTPFNAGNIAEEAGLDGWRFINRMVDVRNEFPGGLDGLDVRLDMTEAEMSDLAQVYAYERRAHDPVPSAT